MGGHDPYVQDANIRDSEPGLSYRASYPLAITEGRSDTANFPLLTNATNPQIGTVTNGFPGVLFIHAQTAALLVNWEIPGEFDPIADSLLVDLNWGDAVGLDAACGFAVSLIRGKAPLAQHQKFVGSAASVGVVPAAIATPGAILHDATSTTHSWRDTTTFSAKGLLPYDALVVKIAPSGNTNDDLALWSANIRIQRHSTLLYKPDRFN